MNWRFKSGSTRTTTPQDESTTATVQQGVSQSSPVSNSKDDLGIVGAIIIFLIFVFIVANALFDIPLKNLRKKKSDELE